MPLLAAVFNTVKLNKSMPSRLNPAFNWWQSQMAWVSVQWVSKLPSFSLSESEMQPYVVRLDGSIVWMFPVAPDLIIYGDSTMKACFSIHGLYCSEPRNSTSINSMNRHICQFDYESVFANKQGFAGLVKEFSDISPVIQTKIIPMPRGYRMKSQSVWGKRTRKPKWE
jgi:hypothetical protein